ncbi:MAG: hypothetical protein WD847_10065 [Pirellulales bacterium]
MYRMSSGDEETLEGPIAVLVRQAAYEVLHSVEALPEWPLGIKAFDELGLGQKIFMLHQVASALLLRDFPAPELTAPVEATAALLFQTIEHEVQFEIDTPEVRGDWKTWRQLVLECFADDPGIPDGPLPAPDSEDMGEWEILVRAIADGVLWDEDWADNQMADRPPAISGYIKGAMDIPADYYVAIVPDPHERELARLVRELHDLTREPR